MDTTPKAPPPGSVKSPAPPASPTIPAPAFSFLKGAEDAFAKSSTQTWDRAAVRLKADLSEALGARHVAFLLGSGCSSLMRGGKQVGIPTMLPLATAFVKHLNDASSPYAPTKEELAVLQNIFGIDPKTAVSGNLEALMELLNSLLFFMRKSGVAGWTDNAKHVESFIKKVTGYVLKECTEGEFSKADSQVVQLYQTFYRKLVFRDRALPRPWVFTTNYDLFNETAMDRMAVPYGNGFSGVVERRFNPANFRYSLGEHLDISSRKWSAADSYVYLCKLHGSVNWIEEPGQLYPMRELQGADEGSGKVMIYPTPAKQAASFAAPYSDLFREFQSRVVREQSVLFVLGYSFADEHVNNIIFQALTVPTFRMVAFVSDMTTGVVAQLKALGDPRIWLISGPGPTGGAKAHYFETFVDQFMPEPPGDKVDEAVRKVLTTFMKKDVDAEESGGK